MNDQQSEDIGRSIYDRFLNGDELAFEELTALYSRDITLFINRYVNDFYIAEEIMIDVFAELASKKRVFSGRSSLKTWLFSIGKHLALNYYRKHRKMMEKQVSLGEIGETEGELSPEYEFIREEHDRELHSALQKLSQNYRVVLHLLFFEHMSYTEAGIVMKKSQKQIDHLVYRAKAALKTELEREGFTYADK
ncbi:MAG: RNA polymerase sigma factor [Clostridiales Family XIII bacterium]|nr:RNA polymerase sigma factor [Clostridiales Family XIII bacterium]